MAIPFLNNITLNNNEIQNVRLQNAGSPPLNSGPGQIYFDTSAGDETAKYYSNITDTWVSLKEYSFPAVTPANGYVTSTITGTFPKPIITFDLNAVDGTASAGERYLTKSNTWAEVSGISGTTYDLEGVGSTNGTAGVRLKGSDATNDDVLIIGAGTTTVTRNANTLTVTSNDQFDGTVTNVSASTTGDALDVTVTSPTIAPDLDFTWAGTASQYVDGQGDLQTFPTIPVVPSNIVETFSNNNTGTYVAYGVTNSLATGDVSIGDVDLTAVDGSAIAGERYLTKSNTWATVASIPGTYSWTVAGDSGSESVLSGYTISFIGGTNVTTAYNAVSNELTINSTDQFQGTLTGITEGPGITVTPSATSPTVAVDYLGADNYLLEAGAATVADSDDIINFSDDTDTNVKKTTLGTIPVESLTLVKNYIDSSASGGVYYQGGYNPTTDTTSPGGYGLQTPPNPNIIEIGWMYTVTADGTFFGEQLRVGDVLIAEIDAPTSLSDWTTVQNNIDFATAGTDTGVGAAIVGISRYDEDDFTVSSTGFVQLTVPAARSGSIAVPNSSTYTYPSSITASATNSVLIQLVDGSTGETVYADVTRLSPTTFSVNYGVTTPTGVIALIQLIG